MVFVCETKVPKVMFAATILPLLGFVTVLLLDAADAFSFLERRAPKVYSVEFERRSVSAGSNPRRLRRRQNTVTADISNLEIA